MESGSVDGLYLNALWTLVQNQEVFGTTAKLSIFRLHKSHRSSEQQLLQQQWRELKTVISNIRELIYCLFCMCVRACACGSKIQSSHYPCYPVLWSTPCMNTPTPTSPFLSHPHPLFTDGGRRTHIDYTDFLKSAPLHYADNTCLTGRNTAALKYVNIQKLTIFHAPEHFETSASPGG